MSQVPCVAVRIEFKQSKRASLGVEMELAIVDRSSGELVSAGSELLSALAADRAAGEHPKAKHELFECTVEIITGVCSTASEARHDLAATLGEVVEEADARGLALICVGTHPFSHWHRQQISPNPRYARLVEQMQWPALRLQIFGVHFHVGVRSAEKSIAIANALCNFLPHLLALAASSPFWQGRDTGLASSRTKVFEALPTAGLPYRVADWAEFEQFMATLVSAGAIETIRDVWWDIRPHPTFGTVELRMCDGIPTLAEVAALAALAQCLVEWLDARFDAEAPLAAPREWVLRENKWQAARHGIDAALIVDDSGRRARAADEIRRLVEELEPVAARLGCEGELAAVGGILDIGPSYVRQRGIVAGGGTLADVVRGLMAELATDRPGASP